MFCTQCGQNLPEHARFCSRCGGKVDIGTTAPQTNPPVEKPTVSLEKPMAGRPSEHQGNPSVERSPEQQVIPLAGQTAAQQAERPEIARAPDPAYDPDEEVKAFVQLNYRYYLRKWAKSAAPEKGIGWNWAAFFLSFFWLAYRKQYGVVLALLGTWIAIDIVNIVFDLGVNNTGFGLFFSVGIAMGANALYYKHTTKQINKINLYPLERSVKLNLLSKKGGTSPGGVFLATGLVVVYVIFNVFYLLPNFGKTEIEFGRSESGNAITGRTSVFEENDSIYYTFEFPGNAGDIEVVLETRTGSDSEIVDRWELEIPSDWSGVIHSFNAPRTGEYTLKVIMDDRVISKGKFSVKGRLLA